MRNEYRKGLPKCAPLICKVINGERASGRATLIPIFAQLILIRARLDNIKADRTSNCNNAPQPGHRDATRDLDDLDKQCSSAYAFAQRLLASSVLSRREGSST